MVVSSQFNYNIPVRSYSILKVKKPVKSRIVAFRKRLFILLQKRGEKKCKIDM